MNHTIPKAFFAYPAETPLRESILTAVSRLNAQSHITIRTWEDCPIGGNFIVNTICREIDEADLFFADLTGSGLTQGAMNCATTNRTAFEKRTSFQGPPVCSDAIYRIAA